MAVMVFSHLGRKGKHLLAKVRSEEAVLWF